MPCQEVTVQGPAITGEVVFTSFNVTPGTNEATVTYEVQNDRNITTELDVVTTVGGENGDELRRESYTLSPGESADSVLDLRFDLGAGESSNVNICSTIELGGQ